MVRSDEGGPNARWAGLEAERDERAGVMRAVSLLLVLVGGGAGCSSDPQVLAQAPDGPSLGLPVEHVVAPIRAWSIIGNGLTPGDERLELRVDSPTASPVRIRCCSIPRASPWPAAAP